MTDIVERLRDKWQHSEDDCYAAADEIERLREALRSIACAEGTCGCAISGIKSVGCFHGIARAALGEGKE